MHTIATHGDSKYDMEDREKEASSPVVNSTSRYDR